ncbi:Crp/Fnr family transcriptional regulator [Tardiphaga sp.]|jgi:CRP-like cAMP-binding protein|uniref:Crp/Fnr family transcriptional regulator n=1 Tax=Tardiphaga sp. TaxID=1926292 RepID=UPI0037D9C5DE
MMEIGRSYSRLLTRLDRSAVLTGADRELIADLPLSVTNVEAGAAIFSGHGDRCFLVVNGFACGSHRLGNNKRQITSIFVPGDFAGLNDFLLPAATDHLSALGPAVIASLPCDALEDALHESPRLARSFRRQSLVEAAILREWITSLGRREALARVAHLVCELVIRLQAVGLAGDHDFPISWTQVDVADACGISAVHANRVVQELRRMKLVEWTNKHLKIRDWDALAALAEFTSDYLRAQDVQVRQSRIEAPALASVGS